MTLYEKAKEIAENGMQREEVYSFLDNLNNNHGSQVGIANVAVLFGQFGVSPEKTMDLFEDWQVVGINKGEIAPPLIQR